MTEFGYPRTTKVQSWKDFLERDLETFEFFILNEVQMEISFNKKVEKLYKNCQQHKLFCPILSNLDGNCLFECLCRNGICDNTSTLRNALSYIMYQYKDYKDFFPGRSETLGELFALECIDVDYVKCKNDEKLYKYTYEIMCMDLTRDSSWGSLPSNLILLILSKLLKIKFVVINDVNNFVNVINAYDTLQVQDQPQLDTIYLGHIFEKHYIPLKLIDKNDNVKYIFYNDAKNTFHKWGTAMAKKKSEEIDKKNIENNKENSTNNNVSINMDQFTHI